MTARMVSAQHDWKANPDGFSPLPSWCHEALSKPTSFLWLGSCGLAPQLDPTGSFPLNRIRIPEHSWPEVCIHTRLLTFQRLTNLPGYAKSNHSHECYSPPKELGNHSF